jgi:hypothetical protein
VGGGGGGGGGAGECEGGGVGEALAGAAVLAAVWLQAVITTAVASATPVHAHARLFLLSIRGFSFWRPLSRVYRARAATTVAECHLQPLAGQARAALAGIIGCMDDLKLRLADAESKLSHVKEYL